MNSCRINANSCYCAAAIVFAFLIYLTALEFYHPSSFRDNYYSTTRRLLSRLSSKSVDSSNATCQYRTMYPTCTKHAVICHRQQHTQTDDLSPLSTMSIHSLKFLLHSILTDLDFKCTKKQSFGAPGLGVYEICMAPGLQPKPHDCLVYSFGVSNDWSFDEAMAQYGCEVHSFDPSIGLEDHQHSPNVTFHNAGLWGSNVAVNVKGWTLKRLSTIRKQLGHEQRVIDILKIDVEGGEWPFLRDVLYKNSSQLSTVRQILTELHAPRFKHETVVEKDYTEMIAYMMDLKKLGFKNFKNFHDGNCCENFADFMPPEIPERCCEEVAMVNVRFLI